MLNDPNRPDCECHGLPMCRNGTAHNGQQQYRCQIRMHEHARLAYERHGEQVRRDRLRRYYSTDPAARRQVMKDRLAQRRHHALNRREKRHGKVS